MSKKDDKKVKPAKKLPEIPGLDSSLFKQAMAEQKSHGVEMKGPKMGRYISLCVACARQLAPVVVLTYGGLVHQAGCHSCSFSVCVKKRALHVWRCLCPWPRSRRDTCIWPSARAIFILALCVCSLKIDNGGI